MEEGAVRNRRRNGTGAGDLPEETLVKFLPEIASEELFVRFRRACEWESQSGSLGRELLCLATVGTVQTELRNRVQDTKLEPEQETQREANSEVQLLSRVLQAQSVVPVWSLEPHTTWRLFISAGFLLHACLGEGAFFLSTDCALAPHCSQQSLRAKFSKSSLVSLRLVASLS